MYYTFSIFFDVTTTYNLLFITIWLFFIIINQIEEISISQDSVITEQRSLIPLLSFKKTIKFTDIQSIRTISNQTSNERGWHASEKYIKNVLEINTSDGSFWRINGNLHPNGARGLKHIIESQLQ